MSRKYSDKEVAEVLLQLLENAGNSAEYPYSGVDQVEYVGQGQYTVQLFKDDLHAAAE